MRERSRRLVVYAVSATLVFILQLAEAHLTWYFIRRINLLEYGLETFTFAAFAVIVGGASGILLASLLLTQREHDASVKKKRDTLLIAALLGVLPLLAIIFKLSFGAFAFLPFSPLGFFGRDFYEWSVNSQVPSLWLGLVIGWLWKRS